MPGFNFFHRFVHIYFRVLGAESGTVRPSHLTVGHVDFLIWRYSKEASLRQRSLQRAFYCGGKDVPTPEASGR